MKSVCIVPIKKESERVKKKNFRLLNGVPLYEHFLNKLESCFFDDIYVDSNDDVFQLELSFINSSGVSE